MIRLEKLSKTFVKDKNKIEVLEMADKAMYYGKRTTKNVVFLAKNLTKEDKKANE